MGVNHYPLELREQVLTEYELGLGGYRRLASRPRSDRLTSTSLTSTSSVTSLTFGIYFCRGFYLFFR